MNEPYEVCTLPVQYYHRSPRCLGDLGKEYGEYRWGVFSRFLARMVRHAVPEAAQYYDRQMAVFDTPISEVRLRLGLPHRVEGQKVHFTTRAGAKSRPSSRRRASVAIWERVTMTRESTPPSKGREREREKQNI